MKVKGVDCLDDPDRDTWDHLCTSTLCINPDHGQWKTRAENTALMQSRRRDEKA